MSQEGAVERSGEKPKAARRQRGRIPRWLVWVGGVVLVLLIAALAAVEYAIHNAEPILRRRVIATLETRFHSPVELDALHISLLNGLQVTGSGLRILYLAGPDEPDAHPAGAPPMLSVDNFSFRSGVRQLFQPTMRVVTVEVQGMRLDIPPKHAGLHGTSAPDDPKLRGQPRIALAVDKIVCTDVTLTIETNKPGKQPLVFPIRNLTLKDVGAQKPFLFDAQLVNAKPVGDIHSSGQFGPWQSDEPRDTPVEGTYSFTHADLGTIKGISGMLSSTGKYSGTLGEIGVTGTTDTPDFALDVSEHQVDLRTGFDATVDGTTGDTRLNSVHATLLHTVLEVNGMIVRAQDAGRGGGDETDSAKPDGSAGKISGHFIDLTVTSDQARIEDILTLGAKTSPPLMQGAMTLRAHLTIPPGHVSVSKKMQVQGTFNIRGETFGNAHWQQTADNLSLRAQGNPKEKGDTAPAPAVSSRMSGSFALANALVTVPDLDYRMPGAQVNLAGKYSLDGNTFDFSGTVRTKATASQMLTGWKSILAMPLDPLLKKNGAGVEIPIVVSGTKSDPKLGVDLGKLGAQIVDRHKQPAQPAPPAAPGTGKQP